jgi:hypothetical protein
MSTLLAQDRWSAGPNVVHGPGIAAGPAGPRPLRGGPPADLDSPSLPGPQWRGPARKLLMHFLNFCWFLPRIPCIPTPQGTAALHDSLCTTCPSHALWVYAGFPTANYSTLFLCAGCLRDRSRSMSGSPADHHVAVDDDRPPSDGDAALARSVPGPVWRWPRDGCPWGRRW